MNEAALSLAIKNGDLNQVKKIVETLGPSCLHKSDIFGTTPLHIAAMYGQTDIAAYLLDKRAYINVTTYEKYEYNSISFFTPLDLAVMYAPNAEIVSLLVAKGAQPDHWGVMMDKLRAQIGVYTTAELDLVLAKIEALAQSPHGLWMDEGFGTEATPTSLMLKYFACFTPNPEFHQKIIATAEKLDALNPQLVADYVLAKDLLLMLPTGESYVFKNGPISTIMYTEGHFPICSIERAASTIAAFDEKIMHDATISPLEKTIIHHLSDIFDTGADSCLKAGLYETSEFLYQQYQQGETILLQTGWEGHAIDIILDKDLELFMVANAGDQFWGLQPGLNAYHHQLAINVDDIYSILNNSDSMALEFKKTYDLGLVFSQEYSFTTPGQSYGNCTWNSELVAEQALIFLDLKKEHMDSASALKLSQTWFNELLDFQQNITLDAYLEKPTLDNKALSDIAKQYDIDTLSTIVEVEDRSSYWWYPYFSQSQTISSPMTLHEDLAPVCVI